MKRTSIVMAVVVALTLTTASVALADSGGPTCADVFGSEDLIANHGQHIVGDYVTGIGHTDLGWPPKGKVGGGGGAVLPGGPGPGFHFPNTAPPGASFCNPQANSGVIYTNPSN